jgi:hypothetical protein
VRFIRDQWLTRLIPWKAARKLIVETLIFFLVVASLLSTVTKAENHAYVQAL